MGKKVLLIFTMLFLMVTIGQAQENWVYVDSKDDGRIYYIDKDYCKLVNIDGFDIWKLKYKFFIDSKDKCVVYTMMYNVDNQKNKYIKTTNYDKNNNIIKELLWDNIGWCNASLSERELYDKIISKLKEDK